MKSSISVNGLIGSLPRIRYVKRRVWDVYIDDVLTQGVSHPSNQECDALAYIEQKYPNAKSIRLEYVGWKKSSHPNILPPKGA